jgi:hypothetical protein
MRRASAVFSAGVHAVEASQDLLGFLMLLESLLGHRLPVREFPANSRVQDRPEPDHRVLFQRVGRLAHLHEELRTGGCLES